jgi:hypothetical protein
VAAAHDSQDMPRPRGRWREARPAAVAPAGTADHLRAMVILRPSLTRKATGWSLLVLGVLGLVLPFLQGFLFLALGVFVLRDQHIWAARRWGWVAGRWPQHVAKVEEMEASLGRRLAGARERIRRLFIRA